MYTSVKKTFPRTYYYIALALLFSLYMLVNPSLVISCAGEAVVLFTSQLLPALFPFMIVIQLLIKIDGRNVMGLLFRPAARIFRIDPAYAGPIFAGVSAGYPNGAVALKNTYAGSGHIYTALALCSAASPMYMLGTVGQIILQNNRYGVIILGCHYAGLAATALLVRAFDGRYSPPCHYKPEGGRKGGSGLFNTLEDVMLQCGKVMVKILGFIILFRILSQTFVQYLLLPSGIKEPAANLLSAMIKGVFEMAEGCSYAGVLPGNRACIVISFILGFGGLSVVFQIMSVLRGLPVRLRGLLLVKLLHGLLSAALCAAVFAVYGGEASAAINSAQAAVKGVPARSPLYLYMLAGCVLFLAARQCPRIWVRFCRTMSRFR